MTEEIKITRERLEAAWQTVVTDAAMAVPEGGSIEIDDLIGKLWEELKE